SIAIYREGAERMVMKRVDGLTGATYDCPEPGYETGCGWPVAYRLQVPRDWPSGVYTADFNTGLDGTKKLMTLFVVREDQPGSTSPILFTLAVNTHNAYNPTGGKSLYDYNSSNGMPAVSVSFLRPYGYPEDGNYYKREHGFVEWAEKSGYPIEYGTNVDLHRDPALLGHYSLFVCCGHDEYWSQEMRGHLDSFVEAGGNAAILSGNTCWWQIRYSPDLKTMICYKRFAFTKDPVAIDGNPANDHLITTNFYKLPVKNPESTTTGLSFLYAGYHNYGSSFLEQNGFGGYRVYRTNHWIFEGTGLRDGDSLGRTATVVGYEADGTLLEARDAQGKLAWDSNGYYPLPGALPYVVNTGRTGTPSNFEVLGVAPCARAVTDDLPPLGHAVMGVFRRGTGGYVFCGSTVDWIWGLAPDPQVSRITANVLDRFTGLDPASNARPQAVVDSISPVSATKGQAVSFRGHGADVDGRIAFYRWRSNIDGFLSDLPSFSVSSLSAGLHTIFFAVRDAEGAWSPEVQRGVQVVTAGMTPGELIVDDGEEGTSAVGTWIVSGGSGYYGTRSVYSKTPGTYAFRVNLLQPGRHEVSAWWTQYPSRHTSVPIHIEHSGGTQTVYVNQQVNGGRWNLLGTWEFGFAATITVESLGGASTCADAVKVKYVGPGSGNVPPTATIESVSPNPANAGTTVTFRGHGSDPDGRVAAYRWRSSIDGELSTAAEFSKSNLSAGAHAIFFSVRDDAGAWSSEVQASLLIQAAASLEPIVLDNDQPGTSFVGSWPVSGAREPYGTTSLYSKGVGATYTYQVPLSQPGPHDIYVWWTEYPSRLTAVPIRVEHSTGTAVVNVNQQTNGGKWNFLGRWNFTTRAVITIESLGGGSTCADAVKVQPVTSSNRLPTATIDRIEPSPAAAGTPVRFEGHGTDIDGSIVGYRWRSSIDGELSKSAEFSRADLSVGSHTIFFSVTDDAGATSAESQGTLQVTADPSAPVVLDDGQPGTSSTGTWLTSGGAGFYGERSVYSKVAGATYTFQVPLPEPGMYDVYVWWTQYSSRLTSVPIRIEHASGTATVQVNQQVNGGRWNKLGSWVFGSSARIAIESLGGGSTCADAVRLVRVVP
ncbi:MAG: N,N-dimethylformamidase beta subunit family domain-containing protein, partial [Planctomycetota bacterium]